MRHTEAFYDRFPILDSDFGYHVVVSVKDAGRKVFAVDKSGDRTLVEAAPSQLRGGVSAGFFGTGGDTVLYGRGNAGIASRPGLVRYAVAQRFGTIAPEPFGRIIN